LRQIADYTLTYLQKAKENQSARLFEEEILYCILRISGDSHSFITRLRDKVRRFIDKILDNSILLKEITANFVNKKPYLERMISIVDPNFDFEQHERNLLYLLKSFEITKDKYKNFLIWAGKYPVPVNMVALNENMKNLEANFDSVTAKDTLRSK
jgi:hypothetical protein